LGRATATAAAVVAPSATAAAVDAITIKLAVPAISTYAAASQRSSRAGTAVTA
jgi:hypothetical protein